MSVKASVSLKKRDGILSTSDDQKYLFFTPAIPPGASPSVTIPIADITNLQQTPASNPKIALKVILKDTNYVFSFTSSSSGRQEQESITETLSNAIAALKAASSKAALPRKDAAADGQPAAMAMAKAASSRVEDDSWYDDKRLKSDVKLQQSLIDSDPALKARFTQALKDKPESVSVTQFTAQFWSTRLHLLRSHAITKAQKEGEYNVLPEIRWTMKRAEKEGEEDTKQLLIQHSQIRLIFKQYPVVREAYNENVPPLTSGQFWERLFRSRLIKKLKAEKITPQDPHDDVFDKYLDRRDAGPATNAYIPHFIDLEGNEQNHSQKQGNRPDETMRPSSFDKVPILRILNNLSESILSHVAPEDGEAHGPIGMNEEKFEQLRLRDLAEQEVDNRVALNIREQKRLFSGSGDQDASAEQELYAKLDPTQVLSSMCAELDSEQMGGDIGGTLQLNEAIGFDPDEDSDDDEEMTGTTNGHTMQVGSLAAMSAASKTIFASINHKRTAATTDPKALNGLSQSTFDAVTTTQNTTIEFLHYFWTVFLSGDAARATELAQLVATLDRSLERIKDVGKTANQERQKVVDKHKVQLQEYQQRTGRKRKFDFDSIDGGSRVVDTMFRPTLGAIKQAETVYRRALEEQSGSSLTSAA